MNLVPGPGNAKRTGYLELFFDLVFVFAVTQLITTLEHDHQATGWFHVALLGWLVWWAWSQFTWAGNAIDLDRRTTRVALLAVTAVTLLFAAALPDAFAAGGAGLRFAVPYVVVRLGGLALYWTGLRAEPEHQAALRSYLPVAVIPPVVVLAGAVSPPSVRPWVWLGAVGLDVASALAAGRGEFRVAPAHFAERHALFVIIALGEAVVGIGAVLAGAEPGPLLAATAVAAFVVVASQWWGYFDWVQEAAEARLTGEPDLRRRGHLARDLFTFLHFPIVLGTVFVAYGVEEALLHPGRPLDTAAQVALGGGLVLFLGGFVLGNARAGRPLLVERVAAAIIVVATIALLGQRLDAYVVVGILAVGLVAATVVETFRRSR